MMHHRLLPGAGAGDLPALVRELRDRGCTAPMEVEVYSDELAALDPLVAGLRAAEALRRVVAEAASQPTRDHGSGVGEAAPAAAPDQRPAARDAQHLY